MYVGVPLDTMALTPAVTGLNPTFQIMMGYIANIQTANVTYMEVETGTIVRAPEFCVGGVVTGTGSVGLPGALNQTISGSTISKPIYTNLTSVPAGTAGCNAAASTPSAPTNVVRTVSGSTVVVSFTIPTSDGGSPITAYEASGDGGTTWYPISVRCAPAPSSTCSADFNAASIKVRAVNLAGAGTASAAAS